MSPHLSEHGQIEAQTLCGAPNNVETPERRTKQLGRSFFNLQMSKTAQDTGHCEFKCSVSCTQAVRQHSAQ